MASETALSGKYTAYPEYKDSLVSGLGLIPSHWEVMQLKRTISGCVNGIWGSEPKEDGSDTIVLRVADFDRPRLNIKEEGYTFRRIGENEKATRKLKRGDLLLEKSGGGEKTLVGQVVLFDKNFEAVTSNFVAKMTPIKGFNSRFLNYVFNRFYSDNINYCSIKQNTGIQNLDSAAYLAEKFGFPLELEQEQITNFLDHETAKIDALIDKQQQLITLLKEKRQAVISHAVTKGLNPNAPMRDSGAEWLGEVPAHWADSEIRYITRQMGGGTPSKERPDYWNGDIPWVSPKDMKIDYIDDAQDKITAQAVQESSTKLIPVGSVLIVVRGMILVHSVPVALTKSEVTINQDMKALIPINGIDGEFLLFFMKGLRDFILDLVEESAHGTKCLRSEAFERMKIATPAFEEQIEIVTQLKEKVGIVDSLIGKANSGIELLNERRTALISAAVTGKIDVRTWQASVTSNKEKEVVA
ncbi:restriction endonuclease subunit S [Paraglaciecola mesophila]|uniref:Restriction endonuclease subunit S n=1 Tax=Paraglaciecola mesophila TaxID=197222 RepID=A0ABU9SPY8_9ALTE